MKTRGFFVRDENSYTQLKEQTIYHDHDHIVIFAHHTRARKYASACRNMFDVIYPRFNINFFFLE